MGLLGAPAEIPQIPVGCGCSQHARALSPPPLLLLCSFQVSSLNLLRVIAEQEGVGIEELNAGRICDWFVKDKERRQVDKESAVLKWDDIPSL